MYKKRFLLLIPLLLTVTLCVSMGPNIINSYIKKDLLGSKNFWTYNEPEDMVVTDAELAQLFVNNGFENGAQYSNGYNDADVLDIAAINKQVKEVLHNVIGEDEAVLNKIESIIDSELVFYDRQIVLTVIGSRTMSFVFVNLIYQNDMEEFEILYEEKTSMVGLLTYQIWEAEKVDWYFVDSIFQSTEIYSEKVLGLNNNQYAAGLLEGKDAVIVSFSVEQQPIEAEKQVGENDGTSQYEGGYYN